MSLTKKLFRKKRPKESPIKYCSYLLHLWSGLVTSIVVFTVSASGSIYVFRNQITDIVNRDKAYITPLKNRLNGDSITAIFKSKNWNISTLRIPRESNRSYKLDLYNSDHTDLKTVYFNPYTGENLGSEDTSLGTFFSLVLDIHTSLLIPQIGNDIVGASILIFVLMLITGFILWIPKTVKQLKQSLKIKWKARFPRLNYDLHRVLGFYCLLPLLFISVTGLYVSYTWVKSGLIQVMGGPPILSINSSNETKDELSTVFNEILQEIKQESPQETNVSLDKIMFSVSEELPYPSHTTINFPSKETATYQVTKLNRENWLKAIFPDVLTYNSTGKLIKTDLFKNKPLHKKFIAISLPLHTGEILGLSGVIFYFIICLICCSLPITGIIIWLKKN